MSASGKLPAISSLMLSAAFMTGCGGGLTETPPDVFDTSSGTSYLDLMDPSLGIFETLGEFTDYPTTFVADSAYGSGYGGFETWDDTFGGEVLFDDSGYVDDFASYDDFGSYEDFGSFDEYGVIDDFAFDDFASGGYDDYSDLADFDFSGYEFDDSDLYF